MNVLVIARIAASATSSGVPIRPAGLRSRLSANRLTLRSSPSASQAPVSTTPGEIALTRIGASSTASDRVSVSAAPLVVYPGQLHAAALVVAAVLLASLLTIRAIAGRQFRARGDSTAVLTPLSVLIGIALWLALFESGIDPVISGLLIGLLTNAYEPRPHGPAAISPNDRIQHRLHPWTSMLVVPIFALANAGLHLDGHVLAAAATSPVTWGLVLAFVVGKPLGIVIAAAVARRRISLGLGDLRGAALSTGAGFTVSLLIASRAFDGALLDQAKVGILATALLAPALAVSALAPRRTAPATRRPATSPCAA
jgi:Na+/H+ antiporter NhaA